MATPLSFCGPTNSFAADARAARLWQTHLVPDAGLLYQPAREGERNAMQYVSKCNGSLVLFTAMMIATNGTNRAWAGPVGDVEPSEASAVVNETTPAHSIWSTRIEDEPAPVRELAVRGAHARSTEPEATAPLPPAVLSGAAMLLTAGLRKAIRNLK